MLVRVVPVVPGGVIRIDPFLRRNRLLLLLVRHPVYPHILARLQVAVPDRSEDRPILGVQFPVGDHILADRAQVDVQHPLLAAQPDLQKLGAGQVSATRHQRAHDPTPGAIGKSAVGLRSEGQHQSVRQVVLGGDLLRLPRPDVRYQHPLKGIVPDQMTSIRRIKPPGSTGVRPDSPEHAQGGRSLRALEVVDVGHPPGVGVGKALGDLPTDVEARLLVGVDVQERKRTQRPR